MPSAALALATGPGEKARRDKDFLLASPRRRLREGVTPLSGRTAAWVVRITIEIVDGREFLARGLHEYIGLGIGKPASVTHWRSVRLSVERTIEPSVAELTRLGAPQR